MVQLQISDGIIKGEVVYNKFGNKYHSFKGIPYAEPPVGELRFKAPIPIKSWQGVRQAKEFGSPSYQSPGNVDIPAFGSEDCLYINVYTPNVKPKTPLPVMVFIHGGAFKEGSSDDSLYGPEFLIRHDVILVTFNYRLGVLGFLCLDTEDIPGNAGMKDQVLALKWVKNNISSFGGDSDNITIFGENAGGACIGFHLISPMSKGLFNRAIAQSGSALNYWANKFFDPRENALALARQLGLYSDDDKELNDFFKNISIDKLTNLDITSRLAAKQYDIELSVVSEKQFGNNERFFYGDIFEALDNNLHVGVEIMTGYCEDEGFLAFAYSQKNAEEALFDRSNNFLEFFVPQRIAIERPIRDQFNVGRNMKEHYFKNGLNSRDNFEGLVKFINMDQFTYELLSFTKFCAKKNNVYLYKFTCKTERNIFANLLGLGKLVEGKIRVCHGDDLGYLFPLKMMRLPVEKDSDTFKSIENVTKLWTNFAKYGNPTPDDKLGVRWLPYTLRDQIYLDIGNKLAVESSPENEDMALWDNVFTKYIPGFADINKEV